MFQILVTDRPSFWIQGADWDALLRLARLFGWEPAGTFCRGAGPNWQGEYLYDHWFWVEVTQPDAFALGDGLRRALPHLPVTATAPDRAGASAVALPGGAVIEGELLNATMSQLSGKQTLVREFIALCDHAPLGLAPSDQNIGDYCQCPRWLVGAVETETRRTPLELARWHAEPAFAVWFVARAVRAGLEGVCHWRHLHCRAGLAQAVAGYLDERPADACLDDHELLLAAAARYFHIYSAVDLANAPSGYEGWMAPLARGFEEAKQPRSVSRQPSPELAPWWRAARLLGGVEVELAAAVMDNLWRRRQEVRCTGERFGWGQNVLVELPRVSLALAQRESYGADERSWPLPEAARMDLKLGDNAVPALIWGPDEDDYPPALELDSDLEEWERLSGLGTHELFPERAQQRT